jgi:hypothetical protein
MFIEYPIVTYLPGLRYVTHSRCGVETEEALADYYGHKRPTTLVVFWSSVGFSCVPFVGTYLL